MQRQFFSGNTVDQAVMTAARHFGTEPERLSYKVRDKKHGFLNARRRIVIEVDPETPLLTDEEIQARAQAARPVEERRPEPRLPAPAFREDRPEKDASVNAPSFHDVVEEGEEEEEDGQAAFGLGVGASPTRPQTKTASERAPSRNRQDSGRGGRKGRGQERPVGEARRPQERGGGQSGRNRRGGAAPQDRRGRSPQERGPGRRNGRPDNRPRRETVKAIEHTWKDGEWRELLTEEGDNVSREVLAFEKAIELILDVMDLDIEFSVSEGETFLVEFSGEDRERLVAEEGRALKAVEHILPRIVRGMVGEALPCRVDCEDFQAAREQELIELAKRTAEEVSATLKPRLLPPMSPADRRIIHVTLMEDPEIDTLSEGDGFIKRIKIFPVRH